MMSFSNHLRKYSYLGVLSALLFSFVHCGSGSSNIETGTGTGDAVSDASSLIDATTNAASNASSDTSGSGSGLIKAVTTNIDNQTFNCDGGGNATINGTITTPDAAGDPSSMSLSMAFNNCIIESVTIVDGTLTFSTTFETNEAANTFDFTFDYDGEIGGNGCLVDFAGLAASISVDLSSGEVTGEISGSTTATCGLTTVTCDYGAGTDVTDNAALDAACT